MRKNVEMNPTQPLVDARSPYIDLNLHARAVEEYAKRKLDIEKYENSWDVVNNVVKSLGGGLSKEVVRVCKIIVDDYWIKFSDLRAPERSCPGERKAVKYVRQSDRLHPTCEKCRKVLVFDIDENFLKIITREFLTRFLGFTFKIARDLGVFVSYAEGDEKKENLMIYVQDLLGKNKLRGRVQWRIGGRYLQLAAPHLFRTAKILAYR